MGRQGSRVQGVTLNGCDRPLPRVLMGPVLSPRLRSLWQDRGVGFSLPWVGGQGYGIYMDASREGRENRRPEYSSLDLHSAASSPSRKRRSAASLTSARGRVPGVGAPDRWEDRWERLAVPGAGGLFAALGKG